MDHRYQDYSLKSNGFNDFVDENRSRVNKSVSPDCTCERSKRHIVCTNCGEIMFGRISFQCPRHPMVSYLYDITNCSRCKAIDYMLLEFDA